MEAEELNLKEVEAKKKADWRKTAKQLKAKDFNQKLLAIAKCEEMPAFRQHIIGI
jgi:hypothetical protein